MKPASEVSSGEPEFTRSGGRLRPACRRLQEVRRWFALRVSEMRARDGDEIRDHEGHVSREGIFGRFSRWSRDGEWSDNLP